MWLMCLLTAASAVGKYFLIDIASIYSIIIYYVDINKYLSSGIEEAHMHIYVKLIIRV